MNFDTKGVITRIFPAEIKGMFESRKFWVNETDVQYPNHWNLEMHQGNCNLLDNFKEGDLVTVSINVRGRFWSTKDGREGSINSLVCWKIKAGGETQPQPFQTQGQTPQFQKPQQKSPANSAAATSQQYFGQQTASASDLAADDLPF